MITSPATVSNDSGNEADTLTPTYDNNYPEGIRRHIQDDSPSMLTSILYSEPRDENIDFTMMSYMMIINLITILFYACVHDNNY